jgi:periplasmic protein TonB
MSRRAAIALGVSLALHGLILLPLPPQAGGFDRQVTGGAPGAQPGAGGLQEPVAVPAPLRVRLLRQAAPAAGDGAGGLEAQSYFERVRAYLHARAQALAASGERGVAEVGVRIAADGSVRAARLTLSSGSATLDAAALRLVRDSAPLPAPPRDMNLRVPIEFR